MSPPSPIGTRDERRQLRNLDILDVVDREGPCTPSQIADRIGWSRATVTGVLARLEADGWIARRVNPDDGRSMTIASTGRIADLDSAYATADQVVEEDEKNAEFAALIADTTRRLRAFNRFDSNR